MTLDGLWTFSKQRPLLIISPVLKVYVAGHCISWQVVHTHSALAPSLCFKHDVMRNGVCIEDRSDSVLNDVRKGFDMEASCCETALHRNDGYPVLFSVQADA